jgi:two-component system response regulator HydG
VERRILIIDDDSSTLEVLGAEMRLRGYTNAATTSPQAALRMLADEDFGLVLSDINLGSMSGVDLCHEVARVRADTPVIVMTAFASIEAAVASIRAGAYDFVTKPLNMDALILTITRARRNRDLREDVKRLQRTIGELQPFEEIIGESAAMTSVCNLITRVASTPATVLVTGESGTGKELVARAIHRRSPRARAPFVAINCAAMPESLLESELFGHTKGAFTDARTARPGLFVKANGGTLFLDEIGDMPMGMQAKLLRALQEHTLRPVGGDEEIPFDTRLVAATNRDLEAAMRAGTFREDLYYRVNVVHIDVPPLRERQSDVLLLALTFLQRAKNKGGAKVLGLKSHAAERLAAYPWPGNVRELQNCIERAVAFAQFDHIGLEDLPEHVSQYSPMRFEIEAASVASLVSLDEVERRYVGKVLHALGGNKAQAARVLGMDRRTLYRKLDGWAGPSSSSDDVEGECADDRAGLAGA